MWISLQLTIADVISQYESMITTGIVGDITNGPLGCGRYWELADTVVVATGESLESVCWRSMHCKGPLVSL